MSTREFYVGLADGPVFYERLGAPYATAERALARLDEHVAEIARKRQTHLYAGRWLIVVNRRTGEIVHHRGFGSAEGKSPPILRRVT